jgi:hypothetical protein
MGPAERCQLPDDAWLPITLYLQAVCQLPGGAVDPWHLQKDANYLMMQGFMSPLYLQAVCQLPSGAGLPGIGVYLQTVANYQKMQGSMSPLYFQAVCQLPGVAGAP